MRRMFNAIAPCYDKLNRLLSLGIDLLWRKTVVSHLGKTEHFLDLATGSGDQLLALLKAFPQAHGIGLDISPSMVELAKIKLAAFQHRVDIQEGDMLHLPFADSSFDAITLSFGIRNVPDRTKALSEMHRCLKKGGKLAILELTRPQNRALRTLHSLYLRHYLPFIGRFFSKTEAYHYLNESIHDFPNRFEFVYEMHEAGFPKTSAIPLWGGLATLFLAEHV